VTTRPRRNNVTSSCMDLWERLKFVRECAVWRKRSLWLGERAAARMGSTARARSASDLRRGRSKPRERCGARRRDWRHFSGILGSLVPSPLRWPPYCVGKVPRLTLPHLRCDWRPEGIPGLPMPRYFSNGLSVCGGSALVVMRGFFFSGRLTIPYVGMEAVLLKDCQRGAMQGRRAADHVERGNPGWYGGTGRGRVLVLGWAALRACQDAGKAAYERNVTKGELGRNTAKVLEAICGWLRPAQ
jgi:hypothetical protein